jgi:acyl-CoA synthetase (AMP-forming)/AMP-acid ligase II
MTERSAIALARDKCSNIVELLRMRAETAPETCSHTFTRDGVKDEGQLTYASLDLKARAVAAQLQKRIQPGERVLLMYRPSLDFIAGFFGCLYAGAVGVPAFPPRVIQISSRIDSIIRDCAPSAVLTTSEQTDKITSQTAAPVFATDELDAGLAAEWKGHPRLSAETLAYLQYTSGSTSDPKGVMVLHGNLMANLLDMDKGWEHHPDSVLVSWLPHFHDMGLVYGILQPLYSGIPGYLMPPLSFLQRPARWLQCITRTGATHSVAPNFAYELCIKKVDPQDRDQLDLSRWAVAVSGAEPVRIETIDRFAEFFGPCGFRREAFCPGYGLAEATLKVTATKRSQSPFTFKVTPTRPLVGCGLSAIDTDVAIVNPETRVRCGSGLEGEIWVSGATVTGGYWNKPEETAKTFGATIQNENGRSFLRTGDLGFIQGEHLFVTGRLKDLIIIRGQNHYPQDIELTSEQSHPWLRQNGFCAAFSIDHNNEEKLVIVQEIEKRIPGAEAPGLTDRRAPLVDRGLQPPESPKFDEIEDAIREAVSERHELQAYEVVLVMPGTLPKTSSGKIQRRACRMAYLDGTLERVR